MISQEIEELYDSISRDLGVKKYLKEDALTFHSRLVYSAIAAWILTTVGDKNDEGDENVSKSHVTITAKRVLNSFIELEPALGAYFTNRENFIATIEDAYVRIGYIESNKYAFNLIQEHNGIALTNNDSISIAPYLCDKTKMVGIASVQEKKPDDIELDKCFLSNLDAKETFERILSLCQFCEMNIPDGHIKCFDFERKSWCLFSKEMVKRYPFTIIRIDETYYKTYRITKTDGAKVLYAELPQAYRINDGLIRNEISRLILGCASFINKPFIAKIDDKDEFVLLKLKYISIPTLEKGLLLCASWPEEYACSDTKEKRYVNNYIVPKEYKNFVEHILKHLSIKIEENAHD